VVEWEIKDTAGVEILLASMTEERKTRIPPTHTAAQIWALLKANGTAYTMESLHATLGELMRISYEPSEEDAEAFYMRVTALADQLNEAENRYGTKIYEVTPAMLLSVIGNALPESWDDLRKDLFRIDAAEIDLEDIQRRLKAFELNCKAKAGGAFRAQGAEPRPAPEEPQEPQANRTGPDRELPAQGDPEASCAPTARGAYTPPVDASQPSDPSTCADNPGAAPPTHDWMRVVVGRGKHLPFNWISILREFAEGAPTSRPASAAPGTPAGHLGLAYSAYMQTQTKHSTTTPHSWCADSGATAHMCKDKELFKTYTPTQTPRYIQGATQNMRSEVKGVGTVELVWTSPQGETTLALKKSYTYLHSMTIYCHSLG